MNDLLNIGNKILVIRDHQIMLDQDLAELYGVETKRLNEAVKRNISRFPEDFCFQITENEYQFLRSQFATSKKGKTRGGRQYLPYAFTEQGVAMLSAVLRSPTAIQMSIKIIKAFVAMRRFLLNNAKVFTEIDSIKQHLITSDQKIDTLFSLMDKYKIENKEGVFMKGQIFDAYVAFQNLIQNAKKEIILIDNYIDLTILERLAKKNTGVNVIIYTRSDTPVTHLDINKFNAQYPTLTIKNTSKMHDRFLILDNTDIYFIGASLKDLGKKCFGFMKLEDSRWINTVLNAL